MQVTGKSVTYERLQSYMISSYSSLLNQFRNISQGPSYIRSRLFGHLGCLFTARIPSCQKQLVDTRYITNITNQQLGHALGIQKQGQGQARASQKFVAEYNRKKRLWQLLPTGERRHWLHQITLKQLGFHQPRANNE